MELQGSVASERILETSNGRKDGRMYFINSPVHKISALNQWYRYVRIMSGMSIVSESNYPTHVLDCFGLFRYRYRYRYRTWQSCKLEVCPGRTVGDV